MSSPLGLVAHCTGIEIEGQLEKSGVGHGWGSRFVVVYVDDQKEWKSSKQSSGSPLLWQQDYRFDFRPSSRITIQLFRKGILPLRQKLGRFSGNLIELFGNNAAFDMTDEAGNRLDGIKIKIQLALISKPPQDIMRKVDAAISRLDDSVLPQISNSVAASPSAIEGSYTSSDDISTCIPSLGQAFASTVKIARKSGSPSPQGLVRSLALNV
ncbi:hypothetical protein HETIRDRAFT_170086 [Heterobasidion irregulare TC 32-1]|uniref:C2 domain-containing protein n=1 Tax=Heterobasidion irregulare (strain TC 32-1) TaxID=747525 RepID=W4KCP5_HETIT|nr:uncharacterized protein HETIRDRAFT_170086 [Heterobasidion irregulare TC 32-1]ETW83637.1 hypothetical protein HETIRDRAFT_170086 [Heterobasidion irregulare TC 32-1]